MNDLMNSKLEFRDKKNKFEPSISNLTFKDIEVVLNGILFD